jgi:DNA-binding NarL/FixJ family response regulator
MGFSKPVRPGKNRARLENLTSIESRIDPAGSVATHEIDGPAARPKVLVTDDPTVFRAGLAWLRAAHARLRVVNPTDEGLDTVARTLRLTPDVVLMDLQVPSFGSLNENGNGSESSTLKVVVLAAEFDNDTVRAIEKDGSSSSGDLDVIPAGVISRILALYASKETDAPTHKPEISKRELSVLSHVAAGQSNKQIGKLLGISQKTVRNHLSRIFHKLRASNRTEAVMNAMRLGLLVM